MKTNISLLYPENYDPERRKTSQMSGMDFVDALSLKSMIVLVNETFRGAPPIRLTDFFTTDAEVIAYRLDVLEELVDNADLCTVLEKALPVVRGIFDMHTIINGGASLEKSLSAIRILESYIEVTDIFYEGFRDKEVHSAGLAALKQMVEETVAGDEYRNLKTDLDSQTVDFSELKSVTIGVNLDVNMQAVEAGLLSVNTEKFKKGTLIGKVTGLDKKDPYTLLSSLYPLPKGVTAQSIGLDVDADGQQRAESAIPDTEVLAKSIRHALEDNYKNAIRSFGPVVDKYFSVNTSVYVTLFSEIRFLLAEVKFIKDMGSLGLSMTKPEVRDLSEKCFDVQGIYNVNLARNMSREELIRNDLKFDDNGRFYLLTGPNHGGKSVFARAVGTVQALFLLGCFVPADRAVLSPVTGIYTHFTAADDRDYGRGRFESECERLVKILRQLGEYDMLLMDESFSGTGALEACYIASEVLTGIGAIGSCGIFVTHIHDLAAQVDSFNSYPGNKGRIDNLSALMQDKEKGTRSYRIARVKPDGLSYASDIAAKCGLNFTDRGCFGA